MSHTLCPYCGASDGRCVVAGGGRFLMECRSCERVVEERQGQVDELFIERAHDAPLCIVTPDFIENEFYKAPPIEEDPFESIGFITAFSTWSLEQAPLFTATSTGFSGQLAELERILSDSLCANGGASVTTNGGATVTANGGAPVTTNGGATVTTNGGATMTTSLNGASMSMVDILKAYFHIVEVSSLLRLERDTCDHAIQLFRDCVSTAYFRNRNIEALATASLVQAMRVAQEPRTLQEVSVAANVPQKDIGKNMKVLAEALRLRQPVNSNSISIHMPRFCDLLQLSESTQDLATHIGEIVINKSFCTRRNPISISAAAIYLSCQLEDKRKTQTEICKATGLTEVTLRKVYKELLENLGHLLPSDYIPAVPLEKAFPGTAAALGRVHVARGGSGVPVSDASLSSTPYNSTASNNNAGFAGDMSSGLAGQGATSLAQQRLASMSGVSATERSTGAAAIWPPLAPDVRDKDELFGLPNTRFGLFSEDGQGSTGHEGATDTGSDIVERDRDKSREEGPDYENLKNINMIPSCSVSGFRPSFFPFNPFDPRVFQDLNPGMWSPLHLYGTPALRPEEGSTSMQGSDKTREDGPANASLPTSKAPHTFLNLLPGMTNGPTHPLQMKVLPPAMQARPSDAAAEGYVMFDRGREPTRMGDPAVVERGAGLESHCLSSSTPNSGASLHAFQPGPLFPGFTPGMWPFPAAAGPYSVYPPQLIPAQAGLAPAFRIGRDADALDKGLESLPQGLLASAGAETMARMGGQGVATGQALGLGSQPSPHTHMLPWPGTQFHPLFLPAAMNVNSISAGSSVGPGTCEARKRDGGVASVDGNSSVIPSTELKVAPLSDRLSILGKSTTGHHPGLSVGAGPTEHQLNFSLVRGATGPHPSLSQGLQSGEISTSNSTIHKTALERQVPH